ncbi:beta strand repeat-containing protein [Synechococcus elongatus]|uniref:DUF4214 domain-containing protein n=1 Tax=Synechococcus elongatus PCC 11801 TaxID=2219813 RepID=A0AAN1QNS5_SYNEL|nr:DUF4214 domain-containing protein [Synechococcus elongatus]AZB72604.1 hypothetical protein DOP62_07685 [Synechococcus elongatus PCC 11801]
MATLKISSAQQLYIAYYGRPADPFGEAFWDSKVGENTDYGAIADAFGNSPEALALFGGLSDAQAINLLYQQIFGRNADNAGLAFYTGLLASGEATLANIAIRIVEGIQEGSPDAAIFANKVEAANAFTDLVVELELIPAYTGPDSIEAARAFLFGVTTTPATPEAIAAAVQASIGNPAPSGEAQFVLTDSQNIVSGTAVELFKFIGNEETLGQGDILSRGAAIAAQLDLSTSGSFDISNFELNGVQTLNLRVGNDALGGTGFLDLGAANGLETIFVNQSDLDTITLSDLQTGNGLFLDILDSATTFNVNIDASALLGDDTIDIRLAESPIDADGDFVAFDFTQGPGGAGAAIEVINIESLEAGGVDNNLVGFLRVSNSLETLNITGDANLEIIEDLGNRNGQISTIDASGLTADLDIEYTSDFRGRVLVLGATGDGDTVDNGLNGNRLDLDSDPTSRPNSIAATAFDVILQDGSDSVITGDGSDSIVGAGGSDTIVAGAFALPNPANTVTFDRDTVDGGAGNNSIVTGDGEDSVIAADGNNTINTAGAGSVSFAFDTVDGGVINNPPNAPIVVQDTITITADNVGEDDVVATGNGNNSVVTGNGSDSVVTGSGNDTINTAGTAVTDAAFIAALNAFVAANPGLFGPGNPLAIPVPPFGDLSPTLVDFVDNNDNDIVNAGDGDNFVTTGTGNDSVLTGSGDDQIDVGDGNNIVVAGAGSDRIIAQDGNDSILAGAGNDEVLAGAGDNIIDAGDGADVVVALGGDDSILGGDGNDSILAGNGNNTIDGGTGNDVIVVGDGDNSILGGSGNDVITADDGNNTILGGAGNDVITVDDGNNSILGGDGDDIITADDGNNTIDGGAGDDVITVDNGSNSILGGEGNDFITFSPINELDSADTVRGGAGTDTLSFTIDTDTDLAPRVGNPLLPGFLPLGPNDINPVISGIEQLVVGIDDSDVTLRLARTVAAQSDGANGISVVANASSDSANSIVTAGLISPNANDGGFVVGQSLNIISNGFFSGSTALPTPQFGAAPSIAPAGSIQAGLTGLLVPETVTRITNEDSPFTAGVGGSVVNPGTATTAIEKLALINGFLFSDNLGGTADVNVGAGVVGGSGADSITAGTKPVIGLNDPLVIEKTRGFVSYQGNGGADTITLTAAPAVANPATTDAFSEFVRYVTANDGSAQGVASGFDVIRNFDNGGITLYGTAAGQPINLGPVRDFNDVVTIDANGLSNQIDVDRAGGANDGVNIDNITGDKIVIGGNLLAGITGSNGNYLLDDFGIDRGIDFGTREALFLTNAQGLEDADLTNFGTIATKVNGLTGGITADSGQGGLIIAQGQTQSAIYFFVNETGASGAGAQVEANELRLLALVDTANLAADDFLFQATQAPVINL